MSRHDRQDRRLDAPRGRRQDDRLRHETTHRSVGGGCAENQVRNGALRCLLTQKRPELIEVDLTDDLGTKGGDVCGGRMWIFAEPL